MQNKANIESLVIENAGQSFTGNDLRSLLGPGVYAFMLNGLPLYVGHAKGLLHRMTTRFHMQGNQARMECDEVRLWPCVDRNAARELEARLIAICRPKYNKRLRFSDARRVLGMANVSQVYPQFIESKRDK